MVLIALGISGTLIEKTSRPGLFISLVFVGIIVFAAVVLHFLRKKANSRIKELHLHMLKCHRQTRKIYRKRRFN